MRFDLVLERTINGWAGANPALDALMSFVALYSPEILAALLLYVYFAPNARRRERRHRAIHAGLAGLIAVGFSGLIGQLWYRPRPFVALPATVHLLIHHAPDSSFPSDHATLAFAIATVLAGLGPLWGWLLVAFGALVAVARVFVGVHWPTDVLAGALLGFLVARGILRLVPWLDPWIERVLAAIGPLGRDPIRRQRD